MLNKLDDIVDLITGSLVLFSSIGLFALTLNARYTHAIGRVRDIYDDLKKSDEAIKLAKELKVMVLRCHLLKWSFGLLLCSGISSGIFLLSSIFFRYLGYFNEDTLLVIVVFSVFFLFIDVMASLKATLIHIEISK
jgi:hypothetical protein